MSCEYEFRNVKTEAVSKSFQMILGKLCEELAAETETLAKENPEYEVPLQECADNIAKKLRTEGLPVETVQIGSSRKGKDGQCLSFYSPFRSFSDVSAYAEAHPSMAIHDEYLERYTMEQFTAKLRTYKIE